MRETAGEASECHWQLLEKPASPPWGSSGALRCWRATGTCHSAGPDFSRQLEKQKSTATEKRALQE
eukprot:4782342-Pyramimonas_sp.AAC.1